MMAVDLYCGLGGWAEGFLAEGFDVIGFDTERHDYGKGGYPGQLVLQDVTTLHGAQLKDADVIVASPPCQEFSYRAMPWKRAKELPPPYLGMQLFWACFRIQSEASEAAGRYVPLVVENVCGAQRWVGKAAWHYGSYFLWGDVPALMPQALTAKVAGFRFDGNGGSFQTAAVKTHAQKVTAADKHFDGYGGNFGWDGSALRQGNSHSPARKAASAQIAKIPFELARWIARTYRSASIVSMCELPGSVSRESV